MNKRRLALSAAAAFLLVTLPATVLLDFQLPGAWSFVAEHYVILLLPGMLVAMMLNNNVHAFSPVTSVLVSLMFWTAIFYGLLSAYAHLRSRRHSPKG